EPFSGELIAKCDTYTEAKKARSLRAKETDGECYVEIEKIEANKFKEGKKGKAKGEGNKQEKRKSEKER
ncbi:MAG: hypothetical protein ACRCUS_03215, partial [Anaerovoracaceae bacterium]